MYRLCRPSEQRFHNRNIEPLKTTIMMPDDLKPEQPQIAVLDGHTLNPGDLSWDPFRLLGTVSVYPRSKPSEIIQRASGADILLVNKVVLGGALLRQLPHLRCICVTATGYNNIDVAYAKSLGITVCNAVGYGAPSVAQHVFALLLECCNHVALHHQSVVRGEWSAQPDFSYTRKPLTELQGKTMGIFGLGRIGRKVAEIALAFGMRVIATSKKQAPDFPDGIQPMDIRGLFAESDVVSLHAPLTPETRGIINRELLHLLKEGTILINTARGELIVEDDLFDALQNGKPAMAALDVLSTEPPPGGHPLFSLPNCIITPHIAWASREARSRLLGITLENIRAFLNGSPQNVV